MPTTAAQSDGYVEIKGILRRPGIYFVEDGVFEIVAGLMLILLSFPARGLAPAWPPFMVLVLFVPTLVIARWLTHAAKRRWIYPRSGVVVYADEALLESPPPPLTVLDLGPPRAYVDPYGGRKQLWLARSAGLLGVAVVASGLRLSRAHGQGDAGGHVAMGIFLAVSLLVAALRWRQWRWLVLGPLLGALGCGIALSGLPRGNAIALHFGLAGSLIAASGTVALVRFLRRHPAPDPRVADAE